RVPGVRARPDASGRRTPPAFAGACGRPAGLGAAGRVAPAPRRGRDCEPASVSPCRDGSTALGRAASRLPNTAPLASLAAFRRSGTGTSMSYELERRISHADVDFLGELKVSALLGLLEQSAVEASTATGFDAARYARERRIWIIRRTRLERMV